MTTTATSTHLCSFDECDRPSRNRVQPLCHGHYRQMRLGLELRPLCRRPRRGETFEEHAAMALSLSEPGEGGCILWTGRTSRKGYGAVSVFGKQWQTHRLAYALAHGIDSIGPETVHHTCASVACINPDHLELATHRQNVGEMLARRAYVARIAELESALAASEARVAELEAQITGA